MMSAPIPPFEKERLQTLASYELLDTPPEASFDRIVEVAAQVCQCPIALFSLVDEHRQWFKSRFGLDVPETVRDDAFCAHAVENGETLVVGDALRDPRFSENPLVLSTPNIRFYAGVPVHGRGGHVLGSLCVIDRSPRALTAAQHQALAALAREVETQLELRQAVRTLEQTHDQRRQLAALLVHDFRGPLTVVLAASHFVQAQPDLPAASRRALDDVMAAGRALQRMALNLLDIEGSATAGLRPVIASVDAAALFRSVVSMGTHAATAAGHRLEATIDCARARIQTDAELVTRVFENLLSNAFRYSPPRSTVRLEVRVPEQGPLVARVRDEGPGVPRDQREAIFEMHVRLESDGAPTRGHGLGLTSCRVALDALGGRIWVEDNAPAGAVFCVELPVGG